NVLVLVRLVVLAALAVRKQVEPALLGRAAQVNPTRKGQKNRQRQRERRRKTLLAQVETHLSSWRMEKDMPPMHSFALSRAWSHTGSCTRLLASSPDLAGSLNTRSSLYVGLAFRFALVFCLVVLMSLPSLLRYSLT